MATKTRKIMTITLQAIECTNSSGDAGANLEIFGELSARGMVSDGNGNMQVGHSEQLFHAKGGINIARGIELPVNTSTPPTHLQ